uniref:Uncharacterized protein n=1 Tax=Strongyloides venezuelensis TaxID=75913 RepID=A0A0K0F5I3_STRVS
MDASNTSSFNSSLFNLTQEANKTKFYGDLKFPYVNPIFNRDDDNNDRDIIGITKEDESSKNPLLSTFPSLFITKLFDNKLLKKDCFARSADVAKNVIRTEYTLECLKILLDDLEKKTIELEGKFLHNNIRGMLAKGEFEIYEKSLEAFIEKHQILLDKGTPNIEVLHNDLNRLERHWNLLTRFTAKL